MDNVVITGIDQQFIRRTWGEWLNNYPWHHWCHLTFANAPTQEAAIQQYRVWIRRLEQRAQQKLSWFYALERGMGGRLHLHALIEGTSDLPTTEIKEAWSEGRAEASGYNEYLGATFYIAKSVGDDSKLVQYDLSDELAAQRPQALDGAQIRLL